MSDQNSALSRVLRWASAPVGTQQRSQSATKRLNLALQGGGAHGAFTWGVLDALLADERIAFDGISGTSAGAVNAVLVADGLNRGGADAARAQLTAFWQAASHDRSPAFTPWDGTPVQAWFDAFANAWSPQEINPLNINPLKDLIEKHVDFAALRASERSLFIAATNVQTGDLRVFERDEISADAVMASASLPFLFRAVEIDGVPYWDGGYTGNPVLTPFLHDTETEDVLLVQINPVIRKKPPVKARDIANRVSEISFNAGLMAELRHIALINHLIDDGRLQQGFGHGEYRRIRLHRIVLDDPDELLDPDSKLNTNRNFLENLRDYGQRAGQHFLDTHFDDVGMRDSMAA